MEKSYNDYLQELSGAIKPNGWTWTQFAMWVSEVTTYFIERNKALEEQLKIENPGNHEELIDKINALCKEKATGEKYKWWPK